MIPIDFFDDTLIALIQVEVCAYLCQKELIELCRRYDIVVTAYGPLGRPGFQKDASEPVLIEEPLLKQLAAKYGRTPAQIALRFLVCTVVVLVDLSFSRHCASFIDSAWSARNPKVGQQEAHSRELVVARV